MPKYYDFKICGYYLYFTAHCIIECMHVHASDRKLTEGGSAKFFVKRQWRHCDTKSRGADRQGTEQDSKFHQRQL